MNRYVRIFLAVLVFVADTAPAAARLFSFNGEYLSYADGPAIWRTKIESAMRGRPQWARIYSAPGDIVALDCLPPAFSRCLVISEESASRHLAEITVPDGRLVDGGFSLTAPDLRAVWYDDDNLLIAAATGIGDGDAAGHARTLRVWDRADDYAAAKTVLALPTGASELEPIFDVSTGGLFHAARYRDASGTPQQVHFDWAQDIARPGVSDGSRLLAFFQGDGIARQVGGALIAYPMQPLMAGVDRGTKIDSVFAPRSGEVVDAAAGRDRLYVLSRSTSGDELTAVRKGRPSWPAGRVSIPGDGQMTLYGASRLADMAVIGRGGRYFLAGTSRVVEIDVPGAS